MLPQLSPLYQKLSFQPPSLEANGKLGGKMQGMKSLLDREQSPISLRLTDRCTPMMCSEEAH